MPIALAIVILIVALAIAAFLGRAIVRRIRWAERGGQRGVWVFVLVILLGGLAAGAFFAIREEWYALRPAPDFVELAEQPDDTLVGTVAFIATRNDGRCVDVVSASGRNLREAGCFSARPDRVEWVDNQTLRVLSFGPLERPQDRWGRTVNVRTGEVFDMPLVEVPSVAPEVDETGPGGAAVSVSSSGGKLRVNLTVDRKDRTLLAVGAPSTYSIGGIAWSETGSWFVAKDDLDRLLLITTAEPSVTRVLAENGYGAAVLDEDLL